MKIWDVSMDIHPDMPVWKGRVVKRPIFTITRDYVDGQEARETRVEMDMHTGTHIDAPLHFVYQGQTMDGIPIEQLVRKAKVVDLTHVHDAISLMIWMRNGLRRAILFSLRPGIRMKIFLKKSLSIFETRRLNA